MGFKLKSISPAKYLFDKYRKGRAADKEQNKQIKKGQEMAIKKEKAAYPVYKEGLKEISGLLEGKHAPTTEGGKLLSDYERFYKGAGEFLQPQFQQQAEQAHREQSMYGAPQLRSEYGANSGQGSKSSALNQALAAARMNLSRQLENDFAQKQMGLASGILQQREQNKQFMQGARSNLASMAIGQPSAYTPPLEMAPTSLQKYGPLVMGAIGAVGGGMATGGAGAVQGYQTGSQLGQTLFR